MKCLSQEWGDAFELYDRLAVFYEDEGLNGVSHNRLARYEILYRFIQKWRKQAEIFSINETSYQDLLMYDLYPAKTSRAAHPLPRIRRSGRTRRSSFSYERRRNAAI